MLRPALIALALLPAHPALAFDPCDDLWFSRNQLYDRAGYCFSTPLGQAIFDNADCTGTEVTLEPGGTDLVAYVREMEERLECAVDTSATSLDIANIPLRLKLDSVVALSEFASGCLGWTGEAIPLRAGPQDEAEVISVAMPGDDLVWEYEGTNWPEGWSFLTVYRDEAQVSLGFARDDLDYDLCTGLAG
ncbi:DUF4453 domain-containing protein [Maritimibacter sp. HL-12]|uniref:DUF4453 domain-containing protein n=1 Tax=Maritimibacter sp. HL-12 TaxID=1162418 RepID=UPI000A0F061D|nr:DUF4453 domain-containing protein [Maritimibacter sp. HL-12]SMH41554.1 YARHG domain-containing protein [Maritimibacter sp. HL-12]